MHMYRETIRVKYLLIITCKEKKILSKNRYLKIP